VVLSEIKIPTPVLLKIGELVKHELNVKEHPEEQINNLMKLIQLVGFKDPIVIDKDNTIWAGHGRLEAAYRLDMDLVPCIYLEDLSESQKKLFMYMDNQINESPWVMENVKILLGEIPQIELEEFQVDFNDILGIDITAEEEPIPEVPAEPKSKRGQIYQLGNHRIMCGDTNTDYKKLLGDKKADLLLTDPPYNLAKYMDPHFYETTTAKSLQKLSNTGWDKDFEPLFAEKFNDYMNQDSSVYIFTSHILFGKLVELVKKWAKFDYFCVWCKPNPMPSFMMRYWTHSTELIVFGTHGKHTFNFNKGEHNFNYLLVNKKKDTSHITEKPTELLKEIITHSSNKNHLVLDLFLGSGSTLIACEQTNRICYGMEIDPGYIDVIIQRWENFTGKKAELIKLTKHV